MSGLNSLDWASTVSILQFDITSYCNAACPGCARNVQGWRLAPGVKLQHFDVTLFERIITQDIKVCRELIFNGNLGDPCMHPELIKFINIYSKFHPYGYFNMHTNGGARSTKWWEDLATSLKNINHKVTFSIDGLEDTNHLYRRNVNFKKLMSNLKAFIQSGGNAIWTMTLFDHNFHQLEECKKLAKEIGCVGFIARKSFDSIDQVITDTEQYTITVDSKLKELETTVYFHKNPSSSMMGSLHKNNSNCPWYNDESIQIDAFHNVWPCCNINSSYPNHLTQNDFSMSNLVKTYGQFNNLKYNTLKEILSHKWFTNVIEEKSRNMSWDVCRDCPR